MFESIGPAGPLVDKERDVLLKGAGGHPQAGHYFNLTYKDRTTRIVTEVRQINAPSGTSKELIWIVNRIDREFTSVEEECEFASIVVEVLTAYRDYYGRGSPVLEVRFREEVWQIASPPPDMFISAGDDQSVYK